MVVELIRYDKSASGKLIYTNHSSVKKLYKHGISQAIVHAAPFTVDALLNSSFDGVGVNTVINLSAGQAFTVSVGLNDLWSAGRLPRWSNADGLVGNLFATGTDESGESAGTQIGANFGLLTQHGISAPFGTLVGELSGTFFTLGTGFSGTAPAAGTLSLFYWDGLSTDNTGSVVANVQTQAVPEPETYLLLLMSLGIVWFAARQRQTI